MRKFGFIIKMNQKILKFCLEKGMLLDKDTLNFLGQIEEETAKKIVDRISSLKERVITKSFLNSHLSELQELINDKRTIEKLKINLGISLEISRERYVETETEEKKESEKSEFKGFKLGNLKILSNYPSLKKKIEVGDFTKYFRARYSELRNFLQERKELEGLSSINKINGKRQSVSIIGLVFEKRVTKNKNILLDVEDLTGRIRVLVNKNRAEIYDIARDILVDDVIGIKGFGNREIIFANEIVYPEAFLSEKITLDRDEKIAFISDIHVGSNNFLEKNFLKFIDWLNGNYGDEEQREESKKIKYLLITGDSVDGVGIFPGQEDLLDIKDIKKQYDKLAEYLKKIRKDIKIIMCPGQHDAVWVAEPQPPIGEDYAKSLHELENLIFVSNPAMIEIGNGEGNGKRGIKILMYHGASMSNYVNEIERLRIGRAHDNPSLVVKELLKRRHLCSIHSSVTYVPSENRDFLLIHEIPDIINTGDFHKTGIDVYNNILIICNSCWQKITPFEEKVGNKPDYCKVPIFNLKTREIKIMDFFDENE